MNKRVLLATLAGGVFNFFAGWFVFGIVMGAYYTKNTMHYEGLTKAEPFMWTFIISSLATAWLLAYIFDAWAKAYTFVKGLVSAIIISIPITISYDLWVYGTMNLIRGRLIIADLVFGAIVMGLTGGVVAFTLSMTKGKNEA